MLLLLGLLIIGRDRRGVARRFGSRQHDTAQRDRQEKALRSVIITATVTKCYA